MIRYEEVTSNSLFLEMDKTSNMVPSADKLPPSKYGVTRPGTIETNIRGVFATGDIQDKKYRQAITGAGAVLVRSKHGPQRWKKMMLVNEYLIKRWRFTGVGPVSPDVAINCQVPVY
ncbi:hypothetical protein K7X08_026984 [Anisodus acutangulus]|uniref:FAD/NAD(P)-binding domain-containing protein n=1 Tax=Anisodus acutangulus TaxID=402998 RepID=A0A9Q1QWF5_9SOLA|nr:hypothetical protein K7X08_026984 [Anisodus acutangulus]